MKYQIYILSLLLFVLVGCRETGRFVTGLTEEHDNKTIIHGSANLEHDSYVSLTIDGSADLQDIKVSKQLDVNGSLKAEDCVLNDVIVQGTGTFEECRISGVARVIGSADFDDCKLKNVEITSSEASFEDCKVSSILMKTYANIFGSSQNIVLEDTVVSGDVTFEQDNGIVVLKGSSKVKGHVVGGKVVKD